MDMTETITPDSSQINADDLIAGPVTVTIAETRKGTAEQPVNINLVEFPGRAYRPSKSMRRVLVAVWGKQSSAYSGKRLTLYRDPEVTFGRDKVGGIKISHMSGLDKRIDLPLTASRGKKASHRVEPLIEQAPTPPAPVVTPDQIAACTDVDQLREWWSIVPPSLRPAVEARSAELKAVPDEA